VSPAVRRFEHGSRVPGWDEAVDLAKDPAKVPDPATTPVDPDLRAEIVAHMAKYPDHRSATIPALAAAQRRFGWLSPEAMEQVACVMRLTPAYLDSVATFYDMLETEPKGRHDVYVCTNISCSMLGARPVLDALLEATEDDREDFNVRAFECLGACDIAPMASVDGVYVGPLEPGDAEAIVEAVRAGREVLPDRQLIRRPVADPQANTAVPGPPAAFGALENPPVPPAGAEAAAAHGAQPMTDDEIREPGDEQTEDEDDA
jgi:NADH-quinone oxidoreductase subunit E